MQLPVGPWRLAVLCFNSSGVGNVPWQAQSTSMSKISPGQCVMWDTLEMPTTSNNQISQNNMCLTGLPGTIHIPTIQVYSGYTQNHNSTSRLHIHPSFPWVAKIIRAISINLWRMTSSLAQMARFQNRSCIWIKIRILNYIKITSLFKFEWLLVLHVSRFFFRWYFDIPLIHQKDCFQGACCWTKGLPKVFRTRANLSPWDRWLFCEVISRIQKTNDNKNIKTE